MYSSTTPIEEKKVHSRWLLTATKNVVDYFGEEFMTGLTQGVQQDLLGGAGGAPVVPAREMVTGPEGESTLRAGGFEQDFIGACPDCGSQLAFIEGCAKCHVCGYSECG